MVEAIERLPCGEADLLSRDLVEYQKV